MANSNIPTLDASNLAYEFEKARISYPEITDKDELLRIAQANKSIPSNLVYLDDTYDKSTGTSATAFQDKNTGEIIIAYTGTNGSGYFHTYNSVNHKRFYIYDIINNKYIRK